jgi:hypothetical protein
MPLGSIRGRGTMAKQVVCWALESTYWFLPKRPWPPGMKFEDGPTERILDRQMPARPAQPGDYGSTGLQCLGSPFAGIGE